MKFWKAALAVVAALVAAFCALFIGRKTNEMKTSASVEDAAQKASKKTEEKIEQTPALDLMAHAPDRDLLQRDADTLKQQTQQRIHDILQRRNTPAIELAPSLPNARSSDSRSSRSRN